MHENELLLNAKKSSNKFSFLYLWVFISIILSSLAIVSNLPGLQQQLLASYQANKPVDNIGNLEPGAIKLDPSLGNINTLQAINLVYSAQLNMHNANKPQALKILNLTQSLVSAEIAANIHDLAQHLAAEVLIDKHELSLALINLQASYLELAHSHGMGQKIIAYFIKVEDQKVAHQQHDFLQQIQLINNLLGADKISGIEPELEKLINLAQELPVDLATLLSEQVAAIKKFIHPKNNVISFEEIITKLSMQLEIK
jgi:hypothetical protein